jgi:hypothetical protein
MMQATLHLNLMDALSKQELDALLEMARNQDKPLERLLYEGAKSLLDKPEPTEPTAKAA